MKVLKFGAIWCRECLVMRPIWEEIEKEISGFKTEYYDADENPEAIKKYKIEDVPVFVFLDKNCQEFFRLEGSQNKDELTKIIKENLNK